MVQSCAAASRISSRQRASGLPKSSTNQRAWRPVTKQLASRPDLGQALMSWLKIKLSQALSSQLASLRQHYLRVPTLPTRVLECNIALSQYSLYYAREPSPERTVRMTRCSSRTYTVQTFSPESIIADLSIARVLGPRHDTTHPPWPSTRTRRPGDHSN